MTDETKSADRITSINPELARRIQDELGQNVYLCYQCVKCSSGCPVAEFFDWQPNQIMRALQLGQEDIALQSETPWLCASCQTCTTRCPQDLDIAGIMEFLTREALERGIKPPVKEVKIFNDAFMREVRIWGRAYEPGLMVEMKLRDPGSMFNDIDLYTRMLKKMKVSFIPSFGHPPRNVKPVPNAVNTVAYYPGCSLESTSTEFNESAKSVCAALDLNLFEPKGWVCCGATAAHRSDPETGLRLPLENLALIERSGFSEVTMPCAACFNRHKAAQYEIRHDESRWQAMDEVLDYHYQDSVKVNTLIETILQHVGKEKIAEKVQKPLENLKVVCYYGCLLTRPPQVTEAENPENPTDMDELVAALGAEVLDWSYKTCCCGAAHSLTRPDIVVKLSGNLVTHARQAGADVIAVACPLCHINLDARQFQMDVEEPMPIMFFTQLMSLALGLPEKEAVLHKNMVDPRPLLREKGIIN
ncbi:MAG TPA: heterodisulfide reductase-related iron-sulfur binding cluster [Anaerolineales bacterium]|nr:heterodisulfide reductase-related iron-sulfur binding cluster [Anaerolineales bacterium]